MLNPFCFNCGVGGSIQTS